MDSKDSSTYPEAIAALQNYITDFGRKRATANINTGIQPPNLDVLYGYMRLLGEKTWTAPTRLDLEKMAFGSLATPAPQSSPRIEPASQTLQPTNNKRKP